MIYLKLVAKYGQTIRDGVTVWSYLVVIVPYCDNAFSGSKNGEHLNELITLKWKGRMKNENSINCDHKIQPLQYNELCMLGFPHMNHNFFWLITQKTR